MRKSMEGLSFQMSGHSCHSPSQSLKGGTHSYLFLGIHQKVLQFVEIKRKQSVWRLVLLGVLQLLHLHLLLLLDNCLLLLNLLLNESLLLQLSMLSWLIIEKSRGLILYFNARSFAEKRWLRLLLHSTCETELRHVGTLCSKFSCIILKESIISDYSLLYLFQLLGRLIVII